MTYNDFCNVFDLKIEHISRWSVVLTFIKFGEISPLHLLYGRCWLFFVTLINGKPFVAAEVASRPYLRHDQLGHWYDVWYRKHDMTARSKFMEVLVGESNWRRDVLMGLASMLRRQPMITQVNLGLMFCRICCRGLNALRHVEAITLDDIDVDGWREYIWCFSLEIQTIRWGRRENPDRYLWRSSGRSLHQKEWWFWCQFMFKGVKKLWSIACHRSEDGGRITA